MAARKTVKSGENCSGRFSQATNGDRPLKAMFNVPTVASNNLVVGTHPNPV